ncbi:MAG: ASKHA domain-containing protein [Verrucomicrobiota bacterium]
MNRTQLDVTSARGRQTIVPTRDELPLRLSEILRREQLALNTRCGQRGLCDGCLVDLVSGGLVHTTSGATVEAPATLRGCEYRLAQGRATSIQIGARSLLAYEPQVVVDFRTNVPRAHDPLVATGIGAAIDIGTTTVAVMLIDLTDGRVLGHAAEFNRQMHLGDDVLTRINLCMTDPTMLAQMQRAVSVETIQFLLDEALQNAGLTYDRLTCLSVAGNTTMLHLFAGVDPSPMGIMPFTPVFLEHRELRAADVKLRGEGVVHLLPSAAAYVGADLCAGVFATGLAYDIGPCLLVDVGTNGEIILKHREHLLGCATAAGPAFEGAGLTSGLRAGDGAIERIRFTREPFAVQTEIIGTARATGICGSGFIDLLADGRRVGLLSDRGRFDPALVSGGELVVAPSVIVSELDISRLLQAKAAIAAGIMTLLERVGLTPADVKTLYLAGGFGMHLDIGNAIGCGLLPGFGHAQIEVVGNTSLAGAYLALLDSSALEEMKRISQRLEVLELNLDPDFESRYIDHLLLP